MPVEYEKSEATAMRPKARIAVVIKLSMRVKPLLSDTDFVVYTADDKLELISEDTMDGTFLLNVSVWPAALDEFPPTAGQTPADNPGQVCTTLASLRCAEISFSRN